MSALINSHADLKRTSSTGSVDTVNSSIAHGTVDVRDEVGDDKILPFPSAEPPLAKAKTNASDGTLTMAKRASMRRVNTTVQETRPRTRLSSISASVTGRPRELTTSSGSFVEGLKRSVTATHPGQAHGEHFTFAFEPMISEDFDSSSSSDEDAPGKWREGAGKETDGDVQKEKEIERNRASRGLSYSQFKLTGEHVKTEGKVSKRDGRLNIRMTETAKHGILAKALGQTIKHHLNVPHARCRAPWKDDTADDEEAESIATELRRNAPLPRLNIVIMVIGSRGDIQPFLKIGKVLQQKHGHRVRVATHSTFRDFVQKDAGLEFFNIGGDPAELMAFMVKNPGLIPSMQTLREGEIQRRRDQMAEMMQGFWRACINATDDEHDTHNRKLLDESNPFIADAIIANPPSFAHVHIAERLGIPLHMMFTFPYTPTVQFPHPLANISPNRSNVDTRYVNFMSYPLVEMMTWQGLGDLVNDLRVKSLGLEPVSSLWAPGALYRMKVPYTYLWSPSLVPKPRDWGPEIDLAGFVFLDLASNYTPPQELVDFLDAGEPPVYIGFGSIVVDDPNEFTKMIFEAVKRAGVRALVNKGWGGFGGGGKEVPEGIYMINNVPHDWLFPRVKAVVHHGGAGTTAIGLKCGKPTMIVPFFGDQPFWGAMVAEAKAGAFQCIPYKKLTVERMAEGIKQCLTEEAQTNVNRIAASIEAEGDGAENAVRSFHRSLPLSGRYNMRCSILEDRVAVWKLRESSLRLSALAAELLVRKGTLKWHDLKLIRHYKWNDFDGPGEPITGSTAAVTNSLYGIGEGVGMVPVRIAKHIRKREAHERKKRAIAEKRAKRLEMKAAQNAAAKGQTGIDNENADPATTGSTDRLRRPDIERGETLTTLSTTISADPTQPLYLEMADDVAHGLARTGYALLSLPMDLHLAIAQGFHNAPRLYGDATVRHPTKITGIKSGFKSASREFRYGIYDGVTGLVTQPIGGWRDEVKVPAKFVGLGKGFAKGIGGFVLKDITAIIAPPVLIGTGVRKYLEKRIGGQGTTAFIRQARITQGESEERNVENDSQQGGPGLVEVKRRVDEGWQIYEEIWDAARLFFMSSGPKPVNWIKYRRERRHWLNNGMLANVTTAKKALEARKHGKDLDAMFAKWKSEMQKAEMESRVPALVVTSPVEESEKTLDRPATETTTTELPSDVEKLGHGQQAVIVENHTPAAPRATEGEEDSDATAVASSPQDHIDRKEVEETMATYENSHVGKGAPGNIGIMGAEGVSVIS